MKGVIVYSGEDIISSRKAFLDELESLKDKDFEITRLSSKEVDKNSLLLALESPSLFGKEKAIGIENFFSGQKSKEKEDIVEYLGKQGQATVLFWETKDFSKKEQAGFPQNFVFKTYKLPQSIFGFLDNLSSRNPSQNLVNFNNASLSADVSFILLMMIRQFRLMIMAKDPSALSGLPSWQQGKIIKQSSSFSLNELADIYRKLLVIDIKQKTSGGSLSLKSSIELFLTEI